MAIQETKVPPSDPRTAPQSPKPTPSPTHPVGPLPTEQADVEEHEGATENDVSDRQGPGVGYDNEPRPTRDEGGVS